MNDDRPTATRDRIVRAAADLLTTGGREAVSTRAVGQAAGVQAPTIYRLFGDMHGLLDAVMSYGFARYLDEKTTRDREPDPVDDLRAGWDLHVGFGVANPALYSLIYGDPRPGVEPTAAREAARVLDSLVQRVARAGRLRIDANRAAQVIHAAGCGVTLTLIATPPELRDPAVSETAREAIIAAVTSGPPATGGPEQAVVQQAVALKASLADGSKSLTAGETAVLREWLDRIALAD